MFPMMMTAAGTWAPAKVLVIGAGVAGLQAIATARRLGAIVNAYDVRPAVKEQIESLGAKFVELDLDSGGSEDKGGYAKAQTEEFYDRQRKLLGEVVSDSDVVITTALVPGRKAPMLVSKEMVEGMRPGAVIVDLATSQGGNCELARPGEEVVHNAVLILGPENLPAETPLDASQLLARNVWELLKPLLHEGALTIDLEDEVVSGALLTHDGEVRHAPTRELLNPQDKGDAS